MAQVVKNHGWATNFMLFKEGEAGPAHMIGRKQIEITNISRPINIIVIIERSRINPKP